MTYTKAAARKLAKCILDLHEEKSYRKIARDDFPGVAAGTLNRIAKEGGEWMPHDRQILIKLGLVEPRSKALQPEWLVRRKKAIRRMAKDTRKAIKKATE